MTDGKQQWSTTIYKDYRRVTGVIWLYNPVTHFCVYESNLQKQSADSHFILPPVGNSA